MKKLRTYVVMTDRGYSDLKKSVGVMFLKKLVVLLPFFVLEALISALLDGFLNQKADMIQLGFTALTGVFVMFLMMGVFCFEYKKTNIPTYYEAERIRLVVAEKLSSVPMSYLSQKNAAEISGTLMDDCARMESFYSGLFPDFLSSLAVLPIWFMILAVLEWRLALAAFCLVPPAFMILFSTMRYERKVSEQQQESLQEAGMRMQEYIEGIQEIRANRMIGKRAAALFNSLKTMRKQSLKMELLAGMFVSGSSVFMEAGIGLVLFSASVLLVKGKVQLLTVIFFFSVILYIYEPISSMLCAIPSVMYARLGMKRIRELYEMETIEGKESPSLTGCDIVFNQVSFGYNSEREVLHKLSFELKEGEITALVGPSGCGKTTITNLLARFWKPESGNITLSGQDIQDMNPQYFGRFVSCVFQNVVLFHDTVFNNIRIGRPEASAEEVLQAAKAAQCMEFIQHLPQGFATVLKENGKSLSGGERQRIAIARAILKNAPILILDEATSALDAENEALVQEGISRLVQNKTVLVVAHRLRNIVEADNILVMDKGKIVARGTHEELIESCGFYKKMFLDQQKSQEWKLR